MKMSIALLLGLLVAIPAPAEEKKANPLTISGYLQPQYVHGADVDTFSVRRGRIKFTYQSRPTSRFVVQADMNSSGVTLKDGYVELIEPWTRWRNTLTAGQFSWPFGFEVVYSSSRREMPERSMVVRTLFPGERDRGVMLSGTGFADRFTYRVALVNGTGTTQSFDANKGKDLLGRVGYSRGALAVGVSGYRGTERVSLGGLTSGADFDKERAGFDFQWTTPVSGLRLRGEYIRGVQPPAPGAAVATARAADVDGWYFYVIQNAGQRHQFTVRADEYDPDRARPGNATRTIGASYIFHWDPGSKLMFAGERPRPEDGDGGDDVLTIRYQYSF